MKCESENDILSLVESFENGTIRREDWRHAEHLTIALYYLSRCDFEASLNKMREGIFNLLKAFDVDLTAEMPYHETLTVFWMRTISEFLNSKGSVSIVEIRARLIETFDRDYPLRFYSRELLFSDQARKSFVEADLK